MALAFQSNTINNFLSTFTSFMNSQVSEVVNKSLTNCSAMNVANVMLGDPPGTPEPRCRAKVSDSQFNILQKARAICNLSVENQTQLTSDIKNGVENNIAQLMQQNNKAVQDFLALGAATFNVNRADFSTTITNEFVNAIRQTSTNICQSIFQATNNGSFILCGDLTNTTINLDQDATVTALTSCINKVLQSATSQGTALNKILTQMDQYQSTEQKGVGSALMWIAIIGGIILLLLIVGAVIWFFLQRGSGGGGSTTQIYAGSYGRPQPQPVGTGPLGAYQFAQSLL
uniref:Uncharacterized protein n=1 Tax=viral metagenome TaxID=1070528 RepID=A0A6C0IZF8_9ZZZZ